MFTRVSIVVPVSQQRTRRVTSADVARLAGVSRATVSYVLNDTPRQTISAGTRTRVGTGLDIAGLRIGVARAFFTDTVHPEAEVVAAFDRSIGV